MLSRFADLRFDEGLALVALLLAALILAAVMIRRRRKREARSEPIFVKVAEGDATDHAG